MRRDHKYKTQQRGGVFHMIFDPNRSTSAIDILNYCKEQLAGVDGLCPDDRSRTCRCTLRASVAPRSWWIKDALDGADAAAFAQLALAPQRDIAALASSMTTVWLWNGSSASRQQQQHEMFLLLHLACKEGHQSLRRLQTDQPAFSTSSQRQRMSVAVCRRTARRGR